MKDVSSFAEIQNIACLQYNSFLCGWALVPRGAYWGLPAPLTCRLSHGDTRAPHCLHNDDQDYFILFGQRSVSSS